LRLESVQNAVDQGRCASQNMIGIAQRYSEVPWFWSNQYHHKIQSAGQFEGHDEVEQFGTLDDDRFALLYRKQGCLIGIDAVNSPREYMEARKVLTQQGARGRNLDDAPGQSLHGLAA
jgi:3-phenylpropionate/trans-cinnamate dioxygenase ferredoxin reductase subunit